MKRIKKKEIKKEEIKLAHQICTCEQKPEELHTRTVNGLKRCFFIAEE